MDELLKNIALKQKIVKQSSLFILHNNLRKYKFKNRNATEASLPYNILMGNSYLIKNNNIIGFYAYCDYNRSMHTKVSILKNMWVCNLDIINLHADDPENIEFLVGGSDHIFQPSLLEFLIVDFIRVGFALYLPK